MTYNEAYELYRIMWNKKLAKGNRNLKPAKTTLQKEPINNTSDSGNPAA